MNPHHQATTPGSALCAVSQLYGYFPWYRPTLVLLLEICRRSPITRVSRALPRCRVLSMRYCPSMDPLAGTAEDTGIEPAPVLPGTVFEAVTTSQYSTIFLTEKAPKWRFPSQLQTSVRPILHWVYTNARGLRVWTPEHAPQHPLCPCSRNRTCDLSPAIGGALPLSYTRDVSVG